MPLIDLALQLIAVVAAEAKLAAATTALNTAIDNHTQEIEKIQQIKDTGSETLKKSFLKIKESFLNFLKTSEYVCHLTPIGEIPYIPGIRWKGTKK